MKEKILITVKTYPVLSRKYQELVCTAGVTEKGEWRRIYPVQFRQLQKDQKYKKYQYVEVDLEKSPTDNRPETFKIVNPDSLTILGDSLPTKDKWGARREAFINRVQLHYDMQELINCAHANKLSLALFQPTEWIKFTHKPCEREWDPNKIAALEAERRQLRLFKSEEDLEKSLKVVKRLPYVFRYDFKDVNGKRSKLMIEDWETGALYWNCLMPTDDDQEESEVRAVKKVAQKYWDEFVLNESKRTLLVLGTTLQFHQMKVPNPFVIVGVIPLPKEEQLRFSYGAPS